MESRTRSILLAVLLSLARTTSAQTPAAPGSGRGDLERAGEAAAPTVVPPQLERDESPVYPIEAVYSGAAGVVRLKLTVLEDGSVADPEIVSVSDAALGEPFLREALAAARRLHFHPATVDGSPRRVRIGFEFSFTSPEQEKASTQVDQPPEEEPVREAASPGRLEGRLLLAGSDEKLPGIDVRIVHGSGRVVTVASDTGGHFDAGELPPGPYLVEISASGYAPLSSREEVVSGQATDITYRLSVLGDEIEVVVAGERPPREVTRRRLERREISRIPGTAGDALRSLESMPGVARPPGLAGVLIVRGSAPGDSETFIDGSSVPLIYHFGGLRSIVPTDMLERIDFYPGNFSVRYGRLMGGVVDVGLRSPSTACYDGRGEYTGKDNCFHGMVQTDSIDGRVMVEGPIAGGFRFAVAGRRSWIDTWLRPVLESTGSSVTNAPVYYDYQLVVERDRGPDDKLSFRFFGSDDRFETIITNPAASDPGFGGNVRFGTAFTRFQALYKKNLSRRVHLDTMLSVGTQSLDFGLGGNIKFVLDFVPIALRSELGFDVHKTVRVNVGLDFQGTPYWLSMRAPPPGRAGEAASGPLATQIPLEQETTGTSFRPAWYTDVEWQPTARLRVVPGVRLDADGNSGNADVSPRLNARYTLVEADPTRKVFGGATVLKAGAGKFAQPPAFQEVDPVFGTPGLRSNDSYHYSLGVEQGVSDHLKLSVEGFYKDLRNGVSRGPDPTGTYVYNNEGSGHVVGLETLLKYDADARFFGWIAYTLSESIRKNCPTCPEYRFQFDQTHNFIILGSYRLGRGWEIGARFRIISGPLATPTAAPPALPAVFSGDAGSYVAIQGAPFSERLPLFHQADIRVDKHFTYPGFRMTLYFDVQNVYNNPAVEGFAYNFDYSQRVYQTGLPILPSIGVRGEF